MNTIKSLIVSLFACAFIAGIAFAADEPVAQGSDPAQKEQELAAALKKCDALNGADKQKCIDAAKKKFGQM